MKPISLTLISILLTLTSFTQTQPQFKFWLAFEDSIGQRDTIWINKYDSLSSLLADSTLKKCNLEIDTLNFMSYINLGSDSNRCFNFFDDRKSISFNIQAQNYHLPITIRWDSSLLRNNGLPWQIKTAQLSHRYLWPCCHNMLLTNSFIALPYTWGGAYDTPFPIELYISDLNFNSVQNKFNQTKIELFPIPASHFLTIKNLDNREIKKIEIMTYEGRILKRKSLLENKVGIMELPNGIYFLKIQTYNQIYYEKFIKIN